MKIAESPIHHAGNASAKKACGVYIPTAIQFALNLNIGDILEWHIENTQIIVKIASNHKQETKEVE